MEPGQGESIIDIPPMQHPVIFGRKMVHHGSSDDGECKLAIGFVGKR